MRAAVLYQPGTIPTFTDFKEPLADDGHEVLEVLLVGLNPVDLYIAAGMYGELSVPCVVGLEGIARLADGGRVYFNGPPKPYGSMAELAPVDVASTFAVPDGLDAGVAVSLGIAGLAAWLPLTWRANLQPGETVLVLGATGVAVRSASRRPSCWGPGARTHQQLDVHAARPVEPAESDRHRAARAVDLDVSAGHGPFLDTQRPQGSAFAIGEAGLTTASARRGYTLSERYPDYVVLGETRNYSFEAITRAIRLIEAGARFIATNPDPKGRSRSVRCRRRLVRRAHQQRHGGRALLRRQAQSAHDAFSARAIDAHSGSTVIVGDRMDTDIVAGFEAGLETILVLSGVTTRDEADRFPYQASRIVESVAELVPALV